MPSLSSKERDELTRAVERMTTLCADGALPNDAIIKTAQEMHLTPDRLPILVNAYNTGATAEHWSQGNSVNEKVASFPVADLDAIRKRLYPVKKASVNRPVDDHFYEYSPAMLMGRDPLDCYRPKLPDVKCPSFLKSAQLETLNAQIRSTAKRAAQKSKDDTLAAMTDLDFALTKLAETVRRPENPDFETFCKIASTVFGPEASLVMDHLRETCPGITRRKLTKSASLPSGHPFYVQMNESLECMKKASDARKTQTVQLQKCAAATNMLDEQWKTALHGGPLERLLLTPEQVTAEYEKKKMRKTALREEYDTPRNLTRLETMNRPEWDGVTEREFGILSALDDDAHAARLRNIVTESIFTDLINTDEFLKTQDPEAVLEAYNDILEVAPNLCGKKMLLRQALREYMASESLDLATLGQLAKLDNDEQAKKDRSLQVLADQASKFVEHRQSREDAKQREEQAVRDLAARREQMRTEIAARASEAVKDRKSREGTAKEDRKSKENIAEKDRKDKGDIASVDRWSRDYQAGADRALRRDQIESDLAFKNNEMAFNIAQAGIQNAIATNANIVNAERNGMITFEQPSGNVQVPQWLQTAGAAGTWTPVTFTPTTYKAPDTPKPPDDWFNSDPGAGGGAS